MIKWYLIGINAILLTLLMGCSSPLSSTMVPSTSEPAPVATLSEETETEVLVYFTSTTRYAQGILPFESPVLRRVPKDLALPQAVLEEYFKGPTQSERELDLEAITSGFTGVRAVELVDSTAHVYLEGDCQSLGATYTIAQPIMRILAQFPEIRYVKIYDENGSTGDPERASHSIPLCLEP